MRIVVAIVILSLALIMRPATGQDQSSARKINVFPVETGLPVRHVFLWDLDGDGLGDMLFVTQTKPPLFVASLRRGPKQGFGPPIACEIGDDCEGVILQLVAGGGALVVLSPAGATTKRMADFKPLAAGARAPGPAPLFFGFPPDLDGDGIGDLLVPVADGFDITLTKTGRRVQVRPPVTRERSAGLRGLLSERARFPLAPLQTLRPGTPPRPCFFANDKLLALQGTLDSGFGPGVDTILEIPSSSHEATLERTEARLVDIDGDGTPELLVVRTKTQGTALTQVTTELILYRLGSTGPAPPAQVILLPGVLSSGPDVRDVDGDGRLDLFLSVYGEDLAHQVARRITGRVRLEYLLYRGSASGPPFSRAPDFSETDSVPEAQFSDWDLRHRLILDGDWSGDGIPDVIQVTVSETGTKMEVRPGTLKAGKVDFPKAPWATAETSIPVKDHRPWRLSASEPAIICRTGTGAVIFAGGP